MTSISNRYYSFIWIRRLQTEGDGFACSTTISPLPTKRTQNSSTQISCMQNSSSPEKSSVLGKPPSLPTCGVAEGGGGVGVRGPPFGAIPGAGSEMESGSWPATFFREAHKQSRQRFAPFPLLHCCSSAIGVQWQHQP